MDLSPLPLFPEVETIFPMSRPGALHLFIFLGVDAEQKSKYDCNFSQSEDLLLYFFGPYSG